MRHGWLASATRSYFLRSRNMFRMLPNRRIASAYRRQSLPLNVLRLEDRTVPSNVIAANPTNQLSPRGLLADIPTGTVKLPDGALRHSGADFYLGAGEQIWLNRRNDQISVTLP